MILDTQYIRDSHGNIRGSIIEMTHSYLLNNKHGVMLGRYDKNVNLTFDQHGNFFGSGNQLLLLLRD